MLASLGLFPAVFPSSHPSAIIVVMTSAVIYSRMLEVRYPIQLIRTQCDAETFNDHRKVERTSTLNSARLFPFGRRQKGVPHRISRRLFGRNEP